MLSDGRAGGCAQCHTPTFPGPSKTIRAYTDLLLHDDAAPKAGIPVHFLWERSIVCADVSWAYLEALGS